MPNLKTHCKISRERTGYTYEELHKWIDESQKYFGKNHRVERHTLNDIHLKYIKEKFGERAVIEWLFHIAIDNMETASVEAESYYDEAYDRFLFEFDKNGRIKDCKYGKGKNWVKWKDGKFDVEND